MPNRSEYLLYLKEQGLQEKDVQPVIPEKHKSKFKSDVLGSKEMMELVVQVAMLASKGDKEAIELSKKLTTAIKLTNHDANYFINTVIKQNLHDHCKMANIELPDNIYVGIFPTNDFNAHIVRREKGFLALINTGFIELIEAVIEIARYEIEVTDKAKIIHRWIVEFIRDSKIPSIDDRIELSKKIKSEKNNSELTSYLTTAAQEFVLLHEYGHSAMNHFNEKVNSNVSGVVYSHLKEYEADFWALHIQVTKSNAIADEYMRAIKIFGFYAFLGIAALMEVYYDKMFNFKLSYTHPPSLKRIWSLEAYLETFNYLDDIYFGTEFLKVLDKITIDKFKFRLSDGIPVFDTTIIDALDSILNKEINHDKNKWYLRFRNYYEEQIGAKDWCMYQENGKLRVVIYE